MGIYAFLDNPELESGSKFVRSITKSCYFCRLDNHSHESCGPFHEYKRLYLAAKYNTTNNTSTARANVVREGKSTTEDKIINDNVNNYM